MSEVATFDAAPFVAAAYGLMAVVILGAIVLSLFELRHWARKARALEREAPQPRPASTEPAPDTRPQTN